MMLVKREREEENVRKKCYPTMNEGIMGHVGGPTWGGR